MCCKWRSVADTRPRIVFKQRRILFVQRVYLRILKQVAFLENLSKPKHKLGLHSFQSLVESSCRASNAVSFLWSVCVWIICEYRRFCVHVSHQCSVIGRYVAGRKRKNKEKETWFVSPKKIISLYNSETSTFTNPFSEDHNSTVLISCVFESTISLWMK